MPNWDLNKVALQLYLNPVLASPVNLLHIFWTPFPKNTFGRLLCGCLDSNVQMDHLWRYYLTVCKETWIFSRYCNKVIRFHWIRISIFNIPGRMKLFTESRIVWKNFSWWETFSFIHCKKIVAPSTRSSQTQDRNWTYIRYLKDVPDIYRTSYVRVLFLCSLENYYNWFIKYLHSIESSPSSIKKNLRNLYKHLYQISLTAYHLNETFYR